MNENMLFDKKISTTQILEVLKSECEKLEIVFNGSDSNGTVDFNVINKDYSLSVALQRGKIRHFDKNATILDRENNIEYDKILFNLALGYVRIRTPVSFRVTYGNYKKSIGEKLKSSPYK